VRKGTPSVHADIIRRIFADRGEKAPAIRIIEGPEAFSATIESGAGVSLIADFGTFNRSDGVVFRPIANSGPDLFLELHALWLDGYASQLTANFIASMRAVAAAKNRLLPAA
jgi:hypothetical protein